MEELFRIDSEEQFRHVVDDIINCLFIEKNSSNDILNDKSIASAKEELKGVIFKTNCDADDVYKCFQSKGYSEERSKIIMSVIENKRDKLLYSMLVNYNSKHGETVETFDWVVKLVYGTSELKKLHYPLLQLLLTTVNKGHRVDKVFDVSKDMLNTMIGVLEGIDTLP